MQRTHVVGVRATDHRSGAWGEVPRTASFIRGSDGFFASEFLAFIDNQTDTGWLPPDHYGRINRGDKPRSLVH